MKNYCQFILIGIVIICQSCIDRTVEYLDAEWPEITHQTKLWTRWWWHAGALDNVN